MYKHSTKGREGENISAAKTSLSLRKDFSKLYCDENLSRGRKQSDKAVRLEDNGTEVTEVLKTQEAGKLC